MHPSIKNSINKTRVLQEIRKNKGISRIEIASELDLDKSTISKITFDLLRDGLITDKKTEEELTHAGRRRIELTINDNFGVVIGLEIQTEYYNVVTINLHGDLLQNYKEILPEGDFLSSLDIIIEQIIERSKVDNYRLLGIGIGIPGHINPADGIIMQSNPLNITEPLNLYKHLEEKYNYPIFIDNDANSCCWGELTVSQGKRDNNFLVALGESRQINITEKDAKSIVVGLGIVIDGKVLIGDSYSAGEFKSMFWNNSEYSQFSLSDKDSVTVGQDRDKTLEVIEELIKHVALFVNCFNFTKVIFAGIFTDYKIDITRMLTQQIRKNWGYEIMPNIDVNFTPFGDYDVSYGAAGMIVEKLFTIPNLSITTNRHSLNGIDLFNYIQTNI